MGSFSDLTPENTIEGGTDGTEIGNTGDALHTKTIGGDPLSPAQIVIDQAHHETHEGNFFHFCELLVLDEGEEEDYIITANSSTYEHFTYIFTSRERTFIEIFEGPTFSGGSSQTVFNKRRDSLNTYPGTIKKTPTITADGNKIDCLFSDKQSGEREQTEWILDPGQDYLLRITSDKNNNDMSIAFNIYTEGTV